MGRWRWAWYPTQALIRELARLQAESDRLRAASAIDQVLLDDLRALVDFCQRDLLGQPA